jgi:hypothetical protein
MSRHEQPLAASIQQALLAVHNREANGRRPPLSWNPELEGHAGLGPVS